MASLRENILQSLSHTMMRHDGGPNDERLVRMYLDDLVGYGKGRVPDAMPSIAFIGWTVPIQTPTTTDVIEAKKVGEGVFLFWKTGVSAISFDIGWGRTFTTIFDNAELSMKRKTLVNTKKGTRTPAMELGAPDWDKGVVIGFKVRNAPTHQEAETVKTIDFIEQHVGHAEAAE